MERNKNSSSWLEEGYQLFAHEGMEGIQVERLARILRLNKSGFYHYFGDIEGYCSELISLHEKKAHDYFHNFDYEYLRSLFTETRDVMQQLSESNVSVESGGPVY